MFECFLFGSNLPVFLLYLRFKNIFEIKGIKERRENENKYNFSLKNR